MGTGWLSFPEMGQYWVKAQYACYKSHRKNHMAKASSVIELEVL